MGKKKIIKITKGELFLLIVLAFTMLLLMGVTMNMEALTVNNGKMPVYALVDWGINDSKHFHFSDPNAVNKAYLTDIIYVGNYMIVSIGDIFICVSAVLAMVFLLRYIVHKKIWANNKTIKHILRKRIK